MRNQLLVTVLVTVVLAGACSTNDNYFQARGRGTSGSSAGGEDATGGKSDGGEAGDGSSIGGSTSGSSGTSAGGDAGSAGRGIGGGAGAGGRGGRGGRGGTAGVVGQAGGGAAGSTGSVVVREGSVTEATRLSIVPRAAAIRGQDLMLLGQIMYDSTTATSSATSLGFELVATEVQSTGSIVVLAIYSKVANGPAGQETTENAELTVTNSEDRYQDLLLFSVHGHDPTDPILGHTSSSGASREMRVAGLSVVRAGSLGLWWKGGYNGQTVQAPLGWTPIAAGQDDVNDVAERPLDPGLIGDLTALQDLPDSWANALLVVQPP